MFFTLLKNLRPFYLLVFFIIGAYFILFRRCTQSKSAKMLNLKYIDFTDKICKGTSHCFYQRLINNRKSDFYNFPPFSKIWRLTLKCIKETPEYYYFLGFYVIVTDLLVFK